MNPAKPLKLTAKRFFSTLALAFVLGMAAGLFA